MSVELRLNIRGTRKEADEAIARLLGRVARETAEEAAANAARRTGFMASTAVAVGPGEDGPAARTEMTSEGERQAAAAPSAGPDEAYAAVLAVYALFVELKQPFLLPAAQAVLGRIERLAAEEGL